jgi:hypothetical protein
VWEAAAAERQRARLSTVDAQARTAVDESYAAGELLRSLADAVEMLEQDSARQRRCNGSVSGHDRPADRHENPEKGNDEENRHGSPLPRKVHIDGDAQ